MLALAVSISRRFKALLTKHVIDYRRILSYTLSQTYTYSLTRFLTHTIPWSLTHNLTHTHPHLVVSDCASAFMDALQIVLPLRFLP